MLVRAITAFVVLPGVVAFVVPIWIGTSAGRPVRHVAIAALVLSLGTLLLVWCVREFYVTGRGTLAPWAPPRRLVMSGPYRWSRNPLYLALTLIYAGVGLIADDLWILVLLVPLLLLIHWGVVVREERYLEAKFGEAYSRYKERVRRWL